MTHARVQRQLSAYLDGELTPADADQVRTHLAGCAICREELSRLQSVKSLLQRLPERSVPEELWTSIRPRIGTPAAPLAASLGEMLRTLVRRPVLALGAAALVGALVALPLVRGRIEWLRAGGFGADLFVREHVLASIDDPFSDRAYLGLLIGDANLALAGTPREESHEER